MDRTRRPAPPPPPAPDDDDDGGIYARRRTRIASFVRTHGLRLPEDVVDVLAWCERAPEVLFITPVLQTSGWEKVGPRTLGNGVYRITVQAEIAGGAVDFLFEDTARRTSYVIEVDGPRQPLPGARDAARRRADRIRAAGFRVVRVPAAAARTVGRSLRADFLREQVARMGEYRRSGHAAARVRTREAEGLAFDVTALPLADRLPMVRGWLRQRGIELSDERLEILSRAGRGPELLFAAELVRGDAWAPESADSLACARYRLRVKPELERAAADLLIEPVDARALRPTTAVRIDAPVAAGGMRPAGPARPGVERLQARGWRVVRVPAEKAEQTGRRWSRQIADEIRAG